MMIMQREIAQGALTPPMPFGNWASSCLVVLGVVLLVAACGSTGPGRPPGDPDDEFDPAMTLVTVERPLLLAGDTVQVTLQARDAAGQPVILDGATVVSPRREGPAWERSCLS
jgi:hypothetical protein